MNKLPLFILLSFLSLSCSRLTVDSSNCPMPIPLHGSEPEENTPFEIKESTHTPLAPLQSEIVDLKEILEAHSLRCGAVRKLEMSFVSEPWDTFRSLVPFWGHKTLILKGETTQD